MTDKKLIEVKNLKISFGSLDVLKDVSIDIKEGEKIVVIGPSGSGKSTFLRCLNRLENPTGGHIIFDNFDLTDSKINLDICRQKMGMVFQHFNLFPHLTVLENITLAPVTLKIKTKDEAIFEARELLKRIGLSDKENDYPSTLSGGQKQRISLARALAVRPSILILDDTTSAVDMETEKQIQEALRHLDFSCTKVIIAQRISTTMMADKILVMQHGRITEMGNHEELMAKKGYYYELVQLQTGEDLV